MFPLGVQSWPSWGSGVENWRQPGDPWTQTQSGALVPPAPRTDLWGLAGTVATDLLVHSLGGKVYYILNAFIHFNLFFTCFHFFFPTASCSWGGGAAPFGQVLLSGFWVNRPSPDPISISPFCGPGTSSSGCPQAAAGCWRRSLGCWSP